jgi:competence protein ComEC
MIRRRITPALLVFTVMAAACILRPAGMARPLTLLVPAVLLASVGCVLIFLPDPARRRAGVLAASAGAGFLLAFLAVFRLGAAAADAGAGFPLSSVTSFSGVLERDSILSRTGRTILRVSLVQAESAGQGMKAAARGTVRVALPGDYRFSLGERIRVRAGLRPLPAGGAPFFASVERRDIRTQGYASGLWRLRAEVRASIHRSLSRAGYPASALLEALLVGSVEEVPPELSRAFLTSGSLHVLALSGLQIAVLYGAAAALLRAARSRVLSVCAGGVLLAAYQLIAGPIPSLMRATLMLAAAGAADILDRDREPLNLLAIAGISMILIDPSEAASPSFQLSFLAIAGILLLGPLAARPLDGRLPPFLRDALAASFAAQLATLPVVLARFGTYYPIGIISGLVLVPLTTLLLWMGMAWLAIFPLLAGVLGRAGPPVFDLVYRLVSWSAELCGRAPGITVPAGAAPWAALAAGAAALALCFTSPASARKVLPGLTPPAGGRAGGRA